MRNETNIRLDKKSILLMAGAAVALFLLTHYWSAIASAIGMLLRGLVPLMIGFALAYVVNIAMAFFERHFPGAKGGKEPALKKPLCLFLSVAVIVLVIVLVIMLVVPQFVSCVQTLASKAPEAAARLTANPQLAALLPDNLAEELAALDWKALSEKIMPVLQSGISGVWESVSSGLSSLVTLFLSFVFALYFLSGKEGLKRQAARLVSAFLKPSRADRMHHILAVLDESFHNYVVGQCTEAVILGILCVLGMLLLRLPYAEMIGTLVGVMSLIPVVGAYIGAAVGAFMILSASVEKAVIFLVFLVVLQQLEGNLIYPRVVGQSVGLPGLWVLTAVSVGGTMLGVAGMLLSVPVGAALFRLLREELQRRETAGSDSYPSRISQTGNSKD